LLLVFLADRLDVLSKGYLFLAKCKGKFGRYESVVLLFFGFDINEETDPLSIGTRGKKSPEE
jgi:hypothetical protein